MPITLSFSLKAVLRLLIRPFSYGCAGTCILRLLTFAIQLLDAACQIVKDRDLVSLRRAKSAARQRNNARQDNVKKNKDIVKMATLYIDENKVLLRDDKGIQCPIYLLVH